jgi:hypothetical protein
MHVVVLVRRDPVELRDGIVVEIRLQLLQRRVVLRLRVARRRIVSPVGRGEEDKRVVLGGVIVLLVSGASYWPFVATLFVSVPPAALKFCPFVLRRSVSSWYERQVSPFAAMIWPRFGALTMLFG